MKKDYITSLLIFIVLILITIFNQQIFNFIIQNRIQELNQFFIWVSYFGTGFFVFIFMTTLFMWEEKKREWIPTLWASLLVASLITYLLKISLEIPRPPVEILTSVEGFRFPSGHATAVFSTIAILDKEYKNFKWFWIIFALIVLYSRVYVGAHYPTDVLAGAVIGYSVSFIFTRLEEKHKIFKPLLKMFKRHAR